MTQCHCGGRLVPQQSGVDVTRTPALSGLMLACEECGRPIRLLHEVRMGGSRETRAQRRALENRVMRAARRMKAKEQARSQR